MAMSDLMARLAAPGGWILADGATGTNLANMGLPAGQPPELFCEIAPERVLTLHRQMIAAGAGLILTNSFGANARRLQLVGAAGRLGPINIAAARLAREAAAEAPRPVIVAGAIGPTGEIMAPLGRLTEAEATQIFAAQARALAEGGVDLLWFETLSSLDEFRAASRAAEAAGMAWCGTMSFEAGGRSMMGASPPQLATLIDRLPFPPLAYGANCGTGPAELLLAVAGFAAAGCERALIAKPNAGVPRYLDGGVIYDATPEAMAEFAVLARDLGVRIIGGCCGTTPAHLAAMHEALLARPRGPRPSADAISARIGALMPDR